MIKTAKELELKANNAMTVEKKKEVLHNAINKAWNGAFDEWEWEESEDRPNKFVLGETSTEYAFYAPFLSTSEYINGDLIWIEYEPKKDLVGIYVKGQPIQAKFKEDFKALFEKHAPFNMKVEYGRKTIPVIFRKEKIEPENFLKYFKEFKKAYLDNYPLFYMFSFASKAWCEGFYINWYNCWN